MGFFINKHHRIHLIFTDRCFRFIIVDKHNKIQKFVQKYLPAGLITGGMIEDEEGLMMIMEQVIAEKRIQRHQVSLCIPNGHTILRTVTIPPDIPSEEIKGYLYMTVGETLHLPFEDPIIEFVEKNEATGQREVLVIAARESIVQQYVQFLKRLKLKPIKMDLSILSLYRLYYHLDVIHEDDHILMVQIDDHSIQLSLFHEHQPIYAHHSLLPGELNETITRTKSGYEYLNIKLDTFLFEDHIYKIVQEISRLQNFYRYNLNHGSIEVNKFLISGDHPYLVDFVARIKQEVAQPVIALTEPLFQTKSNVNIPPHFMECIGLSLSR